MFPTPLFFVLIIKKTNKCGTSHQKLCHYCQQCGYFLLAQPNFHHLKWPFYRFLTLNIYSWTTCFFSNLCTHTQILLTQFLLCKHFFPRFLAHSPTNFELSPYLLWWYMLRWTNFILNWLKVQSNGSHVTQIKEGKFLMWLTIVLLLLLLEGTFNTENPKLCPDVEIRQLFSFSDKVSFIRLRYMHIFNKFELCVITYKLLGKWMLHKKIEVAFNQLHLIFLTTTKLYNLACASHTFYQAVKRRDGTCSIDKKWERRDRCSN